MDIIDKLVDLHGEDGLSPTRQDGDTAILTHYPSAQALANFWLDDEFEDAHKNRVDGVKKSTVTVLEDMG